MISRKIRNSVIAEFGGTIVHSVLMLVHSKIGPLPEFQPNEDIQTARRFTRVSHGCCRS
jgi:hypothetical protein